MRGHLLKSVALAALLGICGVCVGDERDGAPVVEDPLTREKLDEEARKKFGLSEPEPDPDMVPSVSVESDPRFLNRYPAFINTAPINTEERVNLTFEDLYLVDFINAAVMLVEEIQDTNNILQNPLSVLSLDEPNSLSFGGGLDTNFYGTEGVYARIGGSLLDNSHASIGSYFLSVGLQQEHVRDAGFSLTDMSSVKATGFGGTGSYDPKTGVFDAGGFDGTVVRSPFLTEGIGSDTKMTGSLPGTSDQFGVKIGDLTVRSSSDWRLTGDPYRMYDGTVVQTPPIP